MKTIHWFREDLRLQDNPALSIAAGAGQLVPVYFFPEGLGAASYWWLHHSLKSLSASLKEHGVDLIVRTGDPAVILPAIAKQLGVTLLTWNRVYSPSGIALGKRVKEVFDDTGVRTYSTNGQLLIEPTEVLNKQGTPFKVFTPFWRHCQTFLTPKPLEVLPELVPSSIQVESENIDAWQLRPTKPNWASEFDDFWCPGEEGAQARWRWFLSDTVNRYANGRDIPSEGNTSLLSPHLVFGEISANQLFHDTHQAIATREIDTVCGHKFLSEIGWREFSRYLLVHFPHILEKPYNKKFESFPWGNERDFVDAWKNGRTGYPIVDAGMRELWRTGYMHNRVRMIVASFLTKHCLTHWREGADWFWDTLLDADIANNTSSWQWVAGCGADASPYFRVFNPILQGEKFDKEGVYIKRWVPELADLPSKYINSPWVAPSQVLRDSGVTLGVSYPNPIIDHKFARNRALSLYRQIN